MQIMERESMEMMFHVLRGPLPDPSRCALLATTAQFKPKRVVEMANTRAENPIATFLGVMIERSLSMVSEWGSLPRVRPN